jgi:hypothetical protein
MKGSEKRKLEIIQYLEANGYTRMPRSWSSWINPDRPKERYKFTQLALRKEFKNSLGEWHNLQSGYLSGVRITKEGLQFTKKGGLDARNRFGLSSKRRHQKAQRNLQGR